MKNCLIIPWLFRVIINLWDWKFWKIFTLNKQSLSSNGGKKLTDFGLWRRSCGSVWGADREWAFELRVFIAYGRLTERNFTQIFFEVDLYLYRCMPVTHQQGVVSWTRSELKQKRTCSFRICKDIFLRIISVEIFIV